MSVWNSEDGVWEFEPEPSTKEKYFDDYDQFKNTNTPLVFDNGSYHCRVGWGTEKEPRMIFRSLCGKVRQPGGSIMLVGNDMAPSELTKHNAKSPFEGDMLYNFDFQEAIFDHTFSHLGIDTKTIEHPILITESVCNPKYCRKNLNELLFECYNVPSVCYGIDGLFSWNFNSKQNNFNSNSNNYGLIINSGFSATHVMPIIDGMFDPSHTKRLSIGGYHTTDFLMKLFQLYFPQHRPSFTVPRAEEIKRRHCYVATHYMEELHRMQMDSSYFNSVKRTVQLPFIPATSEESLEKQRKTEARRKKQAERLKRLAEERRQEKEKEDKEALQAFEDIGSMKDTDPDSYHKHITEMEFEDEDEFLAALENLRNKVHRKNNNNNNNSKATKQLSNSSSKKSSANWKLLDMDDNELSPSSLKEKKRLLGLRKAQEGRMRRKRNRQEMRERLEREKKEAEEYRQNRPRDWLEDMKQKRERVLNSLKARKRFRAELKDRRSEASRRRSRAIASQAEGTGDDDFGKNEEDWRIYHVMAGEMVSTGNGDDGDNADDEIAGGDISDAEQKLEEIETQIRDHMLEHGMQDEIRDLLGDTPLTEEERYQIQLGVERIRVPEVVFQPSMIGLDKAGLAELMSMVMECYPPEIQRQMSRNVFLCGGNAAFQGFQERVYGELRMARPVTEDICVQSAENMMLDTWHGAQQFSQQGEEFNAACCTRQEYEEQGGDFFKEHQFSNRKYDI